MLLSWQLHIAKCFLPMERRIFGMNCRMHSFQGMHPIMCVVAGLLTTLLLF